MLGAAPLSLQMPLCWILCVLQLKGAQALPLLRLSQAKEEREHCPAEDARAFEAVTITAMVMGQLSAPQDAALTDAQEAHLLDRGSGAGALHSARALS